MSGLRALLPVTQNLAIIDALSSGNDLQPIEWDEGTGRFQYLASVAQAWTALFLSVSESSSGTPGSWIEQNAAGSGPGVEVMGFYTDNSVLPGFFNGQLYVEHSRTDVLPGALPSYAGSRPDIRALDMAIPQIDLNGAVPEEIVPVVDRVYFSVRSDSAAEIAAALNQPITGATIFSATWNPTLGANGEWQDLEIVADYQSLGLQPDDDVDALGVGVVPASAVTNVRGLVFLHSFRIPTATSGRDQIRIASDVELTSQPGIRVRRSGPLYRTNGQRVSTAAGITGEDDDVDGMCQVDPEAGVYTRLFGVPSRAPTSGPVLSFSAHWMPGASNGFRRVRSVVSGGSDMQANAILLEIGLPGFTTPLFVVPQFPMSRTRNNLFEFEIEVPVQTPMLEFEIRARRALPVMMESYTLIMRF